MCRNSGFLEDRKWLWYQQMGSTCHDMRSCPSPLATWVCLEVSSLQDAFMKSHLMGRVKIYPRNRAISHTQGIIVLHSVLYIKSKLLSLLPKTLILVSSVHSTPPFPQSNLSWIYRSTMDSLLLGWGWWNGEGNSYMSLFINKKCTPFKHETIDYAWLMANFIIILHFCISPNLSTKVECATKSIF